MRFAVVMYGGISLAIYINGVAQELFDMVRATATNDDGSKLLVEEPESTEKVYRKLGRLLGLEEGEEDSGPFGPISSRGPPPGASTPSILPRPSPTTRTWASARGSGSWRETSRS